MRPGGSPVAQSSEVYQSAENRAKFAEKRSLQAHSGDDVRSLSIRKIGEKSSSKLASYTVEQCSNSSQRQPGKSVDTSRLVRDASAIISLTDDDKDPEQEEVVSKKRKVGTHNRKISDKNKQRVNGKIAESEGSFR